LTCDRRQRGDVQRIPTGETGRARMKIEVDAVVADAGNTNFL
jgi:hypothetical protein